MLQNFQSPQWGGGGTFPKFHQATSLEAFPKAKAKARIDAIRSKFDNKHTDRQSR